MRINPAHLSPPAFSPNLKTKTKQPIPAGRTDSISISSTSRSEKASRPRLDNKPLDSKTKALLEKAIQEELDFQAKDSDTDPNEKQYGGVCWFATPNHLIMHLLPEDADPTGVTWYQAPYDRPVENLAATFQKETGLPLIHAKIPEIMNSSHVEIEIPEDEPLDEPFVMPGFHQTLPQSLIDWLINKYQTASDVEG